MLSEPLAVRWQIAQVGDGDFEHWHQFDIAIGIGRHVTVAATRGFADIKEGFAIPILHVALLIFGPIQHIEGIPEVIGCGGA